MTNISRCKACGSRNMVVSNSREHGKTIWRTRRCLECNERIYTVELDRKDFERFSDIVTMAAGMKDMFQEVRNDIR